MSVLETCKPTNMGQCNSLLDNPDDIRHIVDQFSGETHQRRFRLIPQPWAWSCVFIRSFVTFSSTSFRTPNETANPKNDNRVSLLSSHACLAVTPK